MDEIHSEINRETLDNPSVACCHFYSPNVKVTKNMKNSPDTSGAFFNFDKLIILLCRYLPVSQKTLDEQMFRL